MKVRLRSTMRQTLTTIVELVGLALVAVGLGLMYVPAGIVAAGLTLVGLGFIEGRVE